MKKIWIVLPCIFMAIILTACSLNSKNKATSEIVWTVKENNENYIIAEKDWTNYQEYYYKIFDNSGQELWTNISRELPEITWLNENNIQVSWGSGNVTQSVFFDLENRLVSDIFNNYEAISDHTIAYMTYDYNTAMTYLVIRDMFDLSVLYQAFSLEDSASVVNPSDLVTAVSFLDNSHLQVTYLTKEDFQSKTIVLEFGT